MAWRQSHQLPEGFSVLKHRKPIIAVGADQPLGEQRVMADYFHGRDGLAGISDTHPDHHPPSETWSHLFDRPPEETLLTSTATKVTDTELSQTRLFTPSPTPAHLEILRLLQENPEKSITIIAVGPLTNCALAAAHDPETFLRVKEILVMGGAVNVPGNITPVAEFNFLADPLAAARVLSLTSRKPGSTLPKGVAEPVKYSADTLPEEKRLRLKLFPLDITTTHTLSASQFTSRVSPRLKAGSPLAAWTSAFLTPTFKKMVELHEEGKHHEGEGVDRKGGELSLHDPMCVWYAIEQASTSRDEEPKGWEMKKGEDIRMETLGQWTRGMCVTDQRGRRMKDDEEIGEVERQGNEDAAASAKSGSDEGGWLSRGVGNRVGRCIGTPGKGKLAEFLLERII